MLRGEQTTWPPGYLVVTESQCHFCFFGCSFLFSYVFLFCILIKRGERPTWQLAWLRAKVNFVLFSCVYFWICFVFLFCFILLICIVWKKRATDLITRPPILVWLRTDVTARMISDAEAQKSFEFFNFYLLKSNCYECKKWLKERGKTIQIGLPTVGEQLIQIYLAKCLKIHNHIASKFRSHANCIFKTFNQQTALYISCMFLSSWVELHAWKPDRSSIYSLAQRICLVIADSVQVQSLSV